MFGPNLDEQERKLRQQGRSLSIGLWAFLFTGRKEDDRQFFDLYADYVDKAAGEDWHCIGFAKSVTPTGVNDKGWRGDDKRHALSQEIRGHIRNVLVTPSATAIVFFNPYTLDQNGRGIYVPLDTSKLSQEDFMKRGLDLITESVRKSRGPDLDDVTTARGIDGRLAALRSALNIQHLRGIATAVFDRAIGPALGRFFALVT
jgi:hypothetical protein